MEARRSRKRGNAVTIRDVAAQAAVSTMTVSRVLNGDRAVADATRLRVQAAIASLNYAPNPAAQSLAGANRIRVGLLYSNPSAAYLSEFLVGSLDQVRHSNLGLVVERCGSDDDEVVATERLIADRIDGIVLLPPTCDNPAVTALCLQHDIPGVTIGPNRRAPSLSSVSIDDRSAAREMTEYLLALGHRRIGFIIGDPHHPMTSGARRQGYHDALASAGIAALPELEQPGLYSYRSGLAATEKLLALDPPPTAIFASNDDMAAAAVAVAHRRGLDVPGELTVVGFDDTALATTIWPELTTIRQPIAAMSKTAINLLVEEIQRRRSGEPPREVRLQLDYTLIERASAAAPRTVARSKRRSTTPA